MVMPCGWEQETPVSLLASTHLTWLNVIPGKTVFSAPVQFTRGHFNLGYFNLYYKPSVFNNFQALSGHESLYSHQRFLNYCPDVLWKRSFANFKFIGISMHKIPYFYILIVIERLYLTLQNEMCTSSSLFLKSIINKIYWKSFKCQCNIFAFGHLVSFLLFTVLENRILIFNIPLKFWLWILQCKVWQLPPIQMLQIC